MQNYEFSWCGTVPSQEALDRASQVELILMDVDGVQTDGLVYFIHTGAGGAFETKGFNSHDGLAFHMLRATGIKYGAISGRTSQAAAERAADMDFAYFYQGHLDKLPILLEIVRSSGLKEENIAYLGDDFTDVVLFKQVGLACAVANARREVKAAAHFITTAGGGQGAVREVAELILKAQGKWPLVTGKYQLSG